MSFFFFFEGVHTDFSFFLLWILIWNSISHKGSALKQPALMIIPKYTRSVDFELILACSCMTTLAKSTVMVYMITFLFMLFMINCQKKKVEIAGGC